MVFGAMRNIRTLSGVLGLELSRKPCLLSPQKKK